MTESFKDFATRDLRLTLLKELTLQPGNAANENILRYAAAGVGLRRSRDVIRNEMRYLAEIGAIRLLEQGSVLIARLTNRGKEHVEGLIALEGVNPPGLEE